MSRVSICRWRQIYTDICLSNAFDQAHLAYLELSYALLKLLVLHGSCHLLHLRRNFGLFHCFLNRLHLLCNLHITRVEHEQEGTLLLEGSSIAAVRQALTMFRMHASTRQFLTTGNRSKDCLRILHCSLHRFLHFCCFFWGWLCC